jgi:hypothetical protein
MDTSELKEEVVLLRASLREFLTVYWGKGDGATPPAFVLQAKRLLEDTNAN